MGWKILEVDWNDGSQASARRLASLADLSIGAIVLRQVFRPAACLALIERFIERNLMYDPRVSEIPQAFVQASVREGGYGRIADPTYSMFAGQDPKSRRRRIDIGTSLGNLGNHPEEFFADAQKTHELFADLFDGIDNPIPVLYESLGKLAQVERKKVMTAHEPDGRFYGPAIFRVHYGGYTYGPHFDSVRLREKRANYAVHRFAEQFAGVMCIQNSVLNGRSAQAIIHRCRWSPDVDSYIQGERFQEYASVHTIPNVTVSLEPGDLYFFNTQLIHEVPGVPGDLPRIVLASFIGYSPDDQEVFVWS
jgi:Carrier-protein-independent halogenase WelO5